MLYPTSPVIARFDRHEAIDGDPLVLDRFDRLESIDEDALGARSTRLEHRSLATTDVTDEGFQPQG